LVRIQKDIIDHNPIMVHMDLGGNDLYNSKLKLEIKDIEHFPSNRRFALTGLWEMLHKK
jgi:hypothetical protein